MRIAVATGVLTALLAASVAGPASAAKDWVSVPGVTPSTQGCVGAGSAGRIAWDNLRNPILSYASSGVRDIGMRLLAGRWHLFFTSVTGNTPDWHIATSVTGDWSSWTAPSVWPAQAGTTGLASPDVTLAPWGTYVMTYQSDPAETAPAGQDKLYYRTSPDLAHWSAPHRLMPELHNAPDDRLIDAALAWTPHGLILGYKYGLKDGQQHFQIAWSPTGSLDGPWRYVGQPGITVYGDTIENYQFLQIDGVWHLLATSNNLDRPWFFTLQGDPGRATGWLDWDGGRELEVPLESWNSAPGIPSVNFEWSNSAYLCDARSVDGYFYLLYNGADELTTYGGWGHTKLGVARSKDLLTWAVPCGPGGVSTPSGCSG